jgi:hypothetical protein
MPIPPEDRRDIALALARKLGRELTQEEKRFLMLSFGVLEEEEQPAEQAPKAAKAGQTL